MRNSMKWNKRTGIRQEFDRNSQNENDGYRTSLGAFLFYMVHWERLYIVLSRAPSMPVWTLKGCLQRPQSWNQIARSWREAPGAGVEALNFVHMIIVFQHNSQDLRRTTGLEVQNSTQQKISVRKPCLIFCLSGLFPLVFPQEGKIWPWINKASTLSLDASMSVGGEVNIFLLWLLL